MRVTRRAASETLVPTMMHVIGYTQPIVFNVAINLVDLLINKDLEQLGMC